MSLHTVFTLCGGHELLIIQRLSLLQVRASDSYYSCDDSIPTAEKGLKSDEFHLINEQPLHNDDMGKIVCGENCEGTVNLKLFKQLCVRFVYALLSVNQVHMP